jgi:glyoxylate/hydroxypyruvate reductase A
MELAMSLLIISDKFESQGWVASQVWVDALCRLDPHLTIEVWPQVRDPAAVEFALVWTYPEGELLKYPNLRAISSLGAGVDHILKDSQRPVHVPVVRIIDKNLTLHMTHYVVWAVLNHARHIAHYRHAQQQSSWSPRVLEPLPHVGIMGLGQLGAAAALALRDLNISISGWSRSPKTVPGIHCYAGEEQLNEFLQHTDILICLLPLTPQTRGILNRNTFAQLKKSAYVINVARGGHLVEADLLAALADGTLSGACLDVFATEPLPVDHPFWQYPAITITPHISSLTDQESVAEQVYENYRRALAGEGLLNQVCMEKGY